MCSDRQAKRGKSSSELRRIAQEAAAEAEDLQRHGVEVEVGGMAMVSFDVQRSVVTLLTQAVEALVELDRRSAE